MKLLNPALLWAGLLALPILLMYMLKLRRKEILVSSTLLWEMILRDRQANTPWQRLRRNLLLFLQLLILTALVSSLARPAVAVRGMATGPVIVLLDGSASMSATDVTPSRFEAARSAARDLIDDLESGAQMTLILVGKLPRTLISAESDHAALRQALDAIPEGEAPSHGAADWQAAFALAAGAVGAQQVAQGDAGPGDAPTIVILSDGGLPGEDLPPLPGEVRYIRVGNTGENLAISALALRPGANGPELFTQLTNYGQRAQSALLSFNLDGVFYSAEQIDIPPGEQRSLTLTGLPNRALIYQAQLSPPDSAAQGLDVFPLDDTAFAVYQPARGGRALLVSAGNLFLEQLLAAIPNLTPFRALAGENGKIQFPKERFDLYVLDGVYPGELPEASPGAAVPSLLFINPPPNPLFEVSGVFSDTGTVRVADHPLVRYVDWSNVHVRQARQIQPPEWADVLVQSEGGPLVFAGETGGRRVAVLSFDLHESDLPLQVTFPILFSSLINYLVPAQAFDAPQGLQPGESLTIGGLSNAGRGQAGSLAIASPSGKVYTLRTGETGVTFNETDELGVYAVNYLGEEGSQQAPPADYFAVNLFDGGESRLLPAETLQIGRSKVPPAAADRLGEREFWPILALLALLVLVLEWLVYHRRLRVSPSL